MTPVQDEIVVEAERAARVLVVEDDAVVLSDLGRSLEGMGYRVAATARTGEDALAAARAEHPDVVLMDIRLDGEIDGVEAGGTIVEELDIPVVYLTAYTDGATRERVRRASPFGYVVKPYQDRELQTAVEVALVRHELELRVRAERQRYGSLLRCMDDGVIAVDERGRVEFMNPAARTLTGWEPEEAGGEPLERVLRLEEEASGRRLQDPLAIALAGDRSTESVARTRLVHRAGGTIPVACSAAPVLVDDEMMGAVMVFRDVTAEREAQRAVERSREMLEGILETTADGILLTDADGDFEYANPAAERILGLERDEISERSYRAPEWEICGPDGGAFPDEQLPVAQVLRRREPVIGVEHGVVRSDGSHVVLSVNAAPLEGPGDELRGVVASIRDVTERKRFEEELEDRALHDYLTGLPNRSLFRDRLEHALDRCRRSGGRLAVCFLDLERFKVVNDTLGHDAGDRVLAEVADRLATTIREQDTVARVGGDEFTVLLEDVECEADVFVVADRIVGVFEAPVEVNGRQVPVDASIGIAVHVGGHHPEAETSDLVQRADRAMYRAKERPGTRWVTAEEAEVAEAPARLEHERRLRRALEDGAGEGVQTAYQPIRRVDDGRLRGVEALARWRDPELGRIPPKKFIPLAEETGLIVPLGEQQLTRACRQLLDPALRDPATGESLRLHVNLSARQLEDPDLVERVRGILDDTGFPAGRLRLEITESAAVRKPRVLEALREIGAELVLDDFGTRYSTLSQLRQLEVDALKIDRTFVDGLVDEDRDRAIVETVLTLGRSLGLGVVAEGVESEDQLRVLRELACDEAQGYHLGRPVRGGELRSLVDRARGSGG